MDIRVTIDSRRCMANQTCTRLAPELFELGRAGYSRLIRSDLTVADLNKLRAAEEQCPTAAIRVETEENIPGGSVA